MNERFELGPSDRARTLAPNPRYRLIKGELGPHAAEKSNVMLQSSGAIDALKALRDKVYEKDPALDPEIHTENVNGGVAIAEMRWDFRAHSVGGFRYNTLTILATSLSDYLFVVGDTVDTEKKDEGYYGTELLTREQYGDPGVLADSLVYAYNHPGRAHNLRLRR